MAPHIGLVSLLAPPNHDGTLPGVIILPGGTRVPDEKKGEKKMWTWDQVKTEEDVRALFGEYFPDAFGRGDGDDQMVGPSTEECQAGGSLRTSTRVTR